MKPLLINLTREEALQLRVCETRAKQMELLFGFFERRASQINYYGISAALILRYLAVYEDGDFVLPHECVQEASRIMYTAFDQTLDYIINQ